MIVSYGGQETGIMGDHEISSALDRTPLRSCCTAAGSRSIGPLAHAGVLGMLRVFGMLGVLLRATAFSRVVGHGNIAAGRVVDGIGVDDGGGVVRGYRRAIGRDA